MGSGIENREDAKYKMWGGKNELQNRIFVIKWKRSGRQTECVKTTTDKCSQRERDAHYRAIDRPTENGRNGREEEIRDNREENSFLLAPKGTAGAGKRRQSLDL